MARLKWTRQAVDDIESICEFIGKDSFQYAQMFSHDVIKAVKRIEFFPLSGRIVPEFSHKKLREVIRGNYRIIYRVHDDTVEILTIYHSARILNIDLK